MQVIVGICTWNRAGLLARTLRSLERVAVPRDVTWRVVVADNNSTDATAAVVESFRRRLPIRRIFVPQQGKSHALNAAIDAMDCDLILWTDDDVEFEPDWMQAYVAAARARPEVGFFGGPIEAAFLEQPPTWIFDCWQELRGVYGEREQGDRAFPLDFHTLPFGANWAVRGDVQKRYRYDERLGRAGDAMMAGEETDLFLRMMADGIPGEWTPQARLAHMVTPERATLDFVERYFFGAGQSRLPNPSETYASRSALALVLWMKTLLYELRTTLSRKFGGDQTRTMRNFTRAAYHWGRMHALANGSIAARLPGKVEHHLRNRLQPRTTIAPPLMKPTLSVVDPETYSRRMVPRRAA